MARFMSDAKSAKSWWISGLIGAVIAAGTLRAGPDEKPSVDRGVDDVDPAREHLPKGALGRLGSFRLRHADVVRAVRFTDDDGRILSVGVDRRVCRWERSSGRLIDEAWTDPSVGYAQSVAVEKDGSVTIGTDTGCVVRIDAAGRAIGEPLRFEATRLIEVSPEGSYVAVASSQAVEVDVRDATGERVTHVQPEGIDQILSVAFSRDELRIAISGWIRETRRSGTAVILVVDVETGEIARDVRLPESFVTKVVFSPDGTSVALGDGAGAVRVMAVETGVVSEPVQKHARGVSSLAYSDDGAWLASGGGDGTVQVFDGRTGEWIHGFAANLLTVTDIDFSDDGEALATASNDNRVRTFSVSTGESEIDSPGHLSPVSASAYAPDGSLIVTGGYDGTVRLWDAATFEPLRVISVGAGFVNDLLFLPDGSGFIVVGQDGLLRRFDVRTGECTYAVRDAEMAMFDVDVSPDGERVATACADGQVRIHDAATGRTLLRFDAGPGFVFAISYSPDGKQIATGTSVVKVWDAETGELVRDFDAPKAPVSGLLYAGPDRIVSCGADRSIRIWAPATGEATAHLEGHPSRVSRIVLAADGETLVSCGFGESAIRMWDLTNPGAGSTTIDGHQKNVLTVAFSPDGRHIVSGAMDAVGYVWERP